MHRDHFPGRDLTMHKKNNYPKLNCFLEKNFFS